jgi:hypothetical protein
MSWTQRFIWAFWIFIAIMVVWEAYAYNAKLSKPDPAHPTQDHYFFYMPKASGDQAAAAAPSEQTGPSVEQTGFTIEDNTPSSSAFTCHVTLKNTGKAKAVGVSVRVRPYHGTLLSNADDGGARNSDEILPEDSPLAQVSQYVTFPDLAPGESSTQSAVFTKQGSHEYGTNPKPEITFEPEKK